MRASFKRKFQSEADYIQSALNNASIMVSRTNVSNTEILLELEYGCAGTIRISDHKNRHNCEYEIGPYILSICEDETGVSYPISAMDKMIDDIISKLSE